MIVQDGDNECVVMRAAVRIEVELVSVQIPIPDTQLRTSKGQFQVVFSTERAGFRAFLIEEIGRSLHRRSCRGCHRQLAPVKQNPDQESKQRREDVKQLATAGKARIRVVIGLREQAGDNNRYKNRKRQKQRLSPDQFGFQAVNSGSREPDRL